MTKTALVVLLAAFALTACNSANSQTANCILWSGNAYSVAQLRDTGKTAAEATEMWMKMIKNMPAPVTARMRLEIAWVYANPKLTQGQMELARHKVCMAEKWPTFKTP